MSSEGLNLGGIAEATMGAPIVAPNRFPADVPTVMGAIMKDGPDKATEVSTALSGIDLEAAHRFPADAPAVMQAVMGDGPYKRPEVTAALGDLPPAARVRVFLGAGSTAVRGLPR